MKMEDNYLTLIENAADSEVYSAELNDYREVINTQCKSDRESCIYHY